MPRPTRNQLEQTIRESGLRVTDARLATLELLYLTASPLAHADVAKHLAKHGVNQATAYRNLNDFEHAGILRRTELGDHVWRFELVAEGEQATPGHPHFLCVDCGGISCLTGIDSIAKDFEFNGHRREVTEIMIRGHCGECD